MLCSLLVGTLLPDDEILFHDAVMEELPTSAS
jgi:hypothetical protein